MSFYTSQVGKKSSRYNNSSLYGTNLSSVYADGPPPLDDSSTQDEDEDEMVFKDTKSMREHVTKDDKPDVKASRDAREVQTTADDDFGDFTSFADFSSAFGSTTRAESNPSWFSTNGECSQATGTFLDSTQIENPPCDDDEFGCFSGGDDSDFEGFKSFSDSNREEVNSNSISNGVRTHGTLEIPAVMENKTHNRPDFFSDDDDDELQFHNDETMNNSTQLYETGFTGLDNPIGMQSTQMPSIFSDDDVDDDFGDFSSSNYDSTPQKEMACQLSMGESGKKEVDSSPTLESKYNSLNKADGSTSIQPISTKPMSHNDKTTSSAKNPNQTVSSEWHSGRNNICSESSPSQKQSHVENQVSDLGDKFSLDKTSVDSRENDEFGDFSTKPLDRLSSSHEKKTSNIDFVKHVRMEDSLDGEHRKLTLNEKESYIRELKEVSTTDADDNTISVEQSIPNDTSDVKLSTSCSQKKDIDFTELANASTLQEQMDSTKNGVYERIIKDTGNQFGDFSSAQYDNEFELSNSQSKEEFRDDVSIVIKSDMKNDEELSKDNLGNPYSGKEKINNYEYAKVTKPSVSVQDDESADISTIACSAKPSQEGDDFGEYRSLSVDKQNDNCGSFATYNKDDEDENLGDFVSPATPESTLVQQYEQNDGFGNFAAFSNSEGTIDNTGNDGTDDDFGDFSFTSVINNTLNNEDNNTGNNLSNVATFSRDTEDSIDDDYDDGFGEFSVTPTINNSLNNKENNCKDDEFGNFSTSPNSRDTNFHDNGNDGDFGNFATFPSSEDTKSNDNVCDDDDFGDFSATPTVISNTLHSKENYKNGSFGNFGGGKNTDKSESNDEFGNFSEISKFTPSTMQDSTLTENSPASFTTLASTSHDFANFSSVKQASKTSVQSSIPPTHRNSETLRSESIFQPQEHTSITVIDNLLKQALVNVQTDLQENIIMVMLQQEIQSGKPSVWQTVKGAERDGSLRFEWEASDHKLQMLASLSMLPVRIQTSSSFKSSGPVQTPLFASGLGLLEPVKGVITPFHHVEEVDPSQDPFAAPPEVGLPDLGFGGNSAHKKETSTGHVEVKDNIDSSFISSSLDLDFLAPSGSTGDLTKTESKALYENDLLGLGMKCSSESPKGFNSNRDHKIFKFNNTTVSLTTDHKNLSEQAKKIVIDFEDLSFMLSKALIFPLKSKE